mmetsp:Transcript_104176/g.185043  ORF Transcript_104176/g.185043 Transcript_104176/m.185043 type:complete len:1009 (+) Transcript_104176:70-3096(+)
MRRISTKVWDRVPGYDSDAEDDKDESEEDEEEDEDEVSEEEEEDEARPLRPEDLLHQVLWALGEKWIEAPFVDLSPVQPGSKFASLAKLMSTAAQVAQTGNDAKPPAFRIDRIHAPLVKDTFLHNGFRPTRHEDWLISWSGPRMRDNIYKMMHEFQRVNHFPSSTELTRKDRMWENFQRMKKVMGKEDFDFVPETFVLPAEIKAFRQRYLKTKGEHLWIVKPAASSQGKGIFILRNLIDLPIREPAVISRYIENPLLIQGLKFDLRIYVLVTSFDPLRAFIYREGLTRFASKPYSTEQEHLSDVYRHLTNYSINKGADNFQENQKVAQDNYGHKWSLSALNRHLKCIGVNVDFMWSGIMDLITKTLLSVEPTICKATREACHHEQSCFELYGFDVLVDENLKPWLLEVNLSPSMQADSPLDRQIKSALLSDSFNLLGMRRVNQQTVTSARLRSRLLYLNKLQNSMPDTTKRRSSTNLGYRQDPLRRSQQDNPLAEDEDGSGVPKEGELEAAPSPPRPQSRQNGKNGKLYSPKTSVSLDNLSESDLKMLAHSLEEFKRCQNFIRLYPTPATTKRYELITKLRGQSEDLRAQLQWAVIFGKKLPTCTARGGPPAMPEIRESELEESEDEEEDEQEDEGEEPDEEAPAGKTAMMPGKMLQQATHNQKLAEETLQTLKVLGSKMGAQLLFLEYLVRIYNTCTKLTAVVRKKLQAEEQSAASLILQTFRKQLTLYLRTAGRRAAPAMTGEVEEDGDVVDQLSMAVFQGIARVLCDTWGVSHKPAIMAIVAPEARDAKKAEDGASELILASCAPTAFASSASGCRAISSLAGLSASDLEWLLKGPTCPLELRNLLELPNLDAAGMKVPARAEDFLRHRLRQCAGAPVGPLSEMEFLMKVNAPRPLPGPRRPPGPKEELPPLAHAALAPRLVRSGLSYSAGNLHKRGRPGPLSPIVGHRANSPGTIQIGNLEPVGQARAYSKSLQMGMLQGGTKVKLTRSSSGYGQTQLQADIEL